MLDAPDTQSLSNSHQAASVGFPNTCICLVFLYSPSTHAGSRNGQHLDRPLKYPGQNSGDSFHLPKRTKPVSPRSSAAKESGIRKKRMRLSVEMPAPRPKLSKTGRTLVRTFTQASKPRALGSKPCAPVGRSISTAAVTEKPSTRVKTFRSEINREETPK